MYRHSIVVFVLGAAVGCSSSAEHPAKEAKTLEACVAVTGAAQGAIEPALVATNAVLRPDNVACFAFDAAHNLHAVPQVPANTPHLSAHMTVGPGMTMLLVQNDTSSDVVYRAMIRVPGAAEWRETSITPVMAGLLGVESWPHSIDAIALFELRQQPARLSQHSADEHAR